MRKTLPHIDSQSHPQARRWQVFSLGLFCMATLCVLTMVLSSAAHSASALAANPQDGRKGGSEAKAVSQIRVDNASDATTEEDMRPYTDQINGTKVTFDMVPIRGGKFLMGSPDSEADRSDAEGPQHEVEIASFWMGKHEVTWDEYNIYTFSLDIKRREVFNLEATEGDLLADAVAHPTKPYVDMSFGMGKDGFPAVCMTQYAAKKYCEWLSAKTGHYYRLPTEAEWEYACRAGTTTAYSFGGGTDNIDEYAWHLDNSGEKYHKVGEKKPNPWGLFDMHGNVSEWVLDAFDPSYYGKLQGVTSNPLNQPTQEYSRTVRGGSWDDFPEDLRSSVRKVSEPLWKERDPQDPQSIWYLTDAPFVGFRIVRPLVEPSDDEKKKYGPDKYQDGS